LSSVSIWTGKNDDIPIQITDPDFTMLGIWIDMRLLDDLRIQLPNARKSVVELIGLEPEEHSKAMGSGIWITEIGMFVVAPFVKLHHHLVADDQLLI